MQKLVVVGLLGASPHMADMYQFGVLPITFLRNHFIQTTLQRPLSVTSGPLPDSRTKHTQE